MDFRKLIFSFYIFFLLSHFVSAQCDLQIQDCFRNVGKSKTIYFFVHNTLPNQPINQRIYLQEGYFYTFSACVSKGLGEMIFGIENTQGELIKNNIVKENELKNSFEWYCKKTGFYYLIYWLHEGAGCVAIQVSMHPPKL